MFVTWRGQPGLSDEPQHELMGEITDVLIRDIGVGCSHLPETSEELGTALDAAKANMQERNLPYAFVVAKGTVADAGLDQVDLAPLPPGTYQTFVVVAPVPVAMKTWRKSFWRLRIRQRSSQRQASAVASYSPSRTASSTSIKWDRWAAPVRWDLAWR